MEIWYAVCGLFAGILGGMGMGGGTVLIPLLTMVLGVEQLSAQATNLIVFVPMSVVALFLHFKNKLIDGSSLKPFVPLAVAGAIGGALLASHVKGGALKICFGVFLIALGVLQAILAYTVKESKQKEKEGEKANIQKKGERA